MPATRLTNDDLEAAVTRQLDLLVRELADEVGEDEIRTLGKLHYERLTATATVTDFVPLFVYRYAREDVRIARRSVDLAA